ncbi:MAG: hypothetical protein ACWA44_14235 [Thiotrichales bacterium]
MHITALEQHRVIKLIRFSLDNRSFSAAEALNQTGMGMSEFVAVANEIYCEGKDIDHSLNLNEVLSWNLTPESLFQYMSFLEYKDSLETAKRATVIAIASIVISGALALAQLVT